MKLNRIQFLIKLWSLLCNIRPVKNKRDAEFKQSRRFDSNTRQSYDQTASDKNQLMAMLSYPTSNSLQSPLQILHPKPSKIHSSAQQQVWLYVLAHMPCTEKTICVLNSSIDWNSFVNCHSRRRIWACQPASPEPNFWKSSTQSLTYLH